jgi:Mrp family chromosome partitioning ATPase
MSMTDRRSRRGRRDRHSGDAHTAAGPTSNGEQPSMSGKPSSGDGGSNEAHLPAKPVRQTAGHSAPAMPAHEDIPAELAEALRGIINRSELRDGRPLPQTIALTSAVLGEGVTTVSKSLATLIASEMGRFVCWIDCSWLTGDLDGAQDDRPNLIDILADDSRMEGAFETIPGQPSLVSLSPGPVPESQRNLIARSPEFEQLLGILKDEFDQIIFDLPPVLSHANSIALLRQVDAAILVVRHRSTSIAQVERAIEAMHPTPNLAVVLNEYRSSIPRRVRRLLGG